MLIEGDTIIPFEGPLHWLSFADADLPEGSQFLGVVVTQAADFMFAVMKCNFNGINPGGEVQGVEIPEQFNVPAEYRDRLLTRAECEELDKIMEIRQ